MKPAPDNAFAFNRRFDRLGRLIGAPGIKRLSESHVMVLGLGGVGSWAAEALVRSGIGKLTLIDFDEICITNTNRQLQASSEQIGKQKALVLAERFRLINPEILIYPVVKHYNDQTADEIFATDSIPDFVIDAIDQVTAKCHLINFCHKNNIPLVCSTGAGGKLDPTRVIVKDLADTQIDPLAKAIRRILREQYDFPLLGPYGISAVFSTETALAPRTPEHPLREDLNACSVKDGIPHDCDSKLVILGTAAFVTATFGMICASVVVKALLNAVTPDESQPD